MESRRPFCSEVSADSEEPLAATASRVSNWILIEYRGLWGRDAVDSSSLAAAVKHHLRERAQTLGPAKVLFVRRLERRDRGGLCVFWGSSPERGGRLYRAELERYEDLLRLDLETPGDELRHPLLLVCTHGKHDRCCARYGRPLYEAFREQVEEGWAWQCSHVGGDRFAGNLVCLPEGLYFGRVGPGDAWPVLDEYLAGRIHLDLYRGRSCYPFRVQAAEQAIRARTGLTAIEDLELLAESPIRFRAGRQVYEAEVDEERGGLTYLTCAAERLIRPRRYAVRSLRESAA